MNRTSELAYWINEREYMRLRKEDLLGGQDIHAPPWSADPAMANVRYCNVHREDDKVTRWIAGYWRNPNAESQWLTLGMVTARMINWPPTLRLINFPNDTQGILQWMRDAKQEIREMQDEGEKMWTSAYTISTCGRAMKKEDYVFDHVLTQVADTSWDFAGSNLAGAYLRFTRIDGLGSFLAGQVVADLKNTPGHPLQTAPDFWTWSAPGPGSLRGLEAYFERKITPRNYHRAIEQCYNEVIPHVHEYVGRIHMQDFQNCLCEFSKFMRVKEGDGRVRNKYPSGRADDTA